MPTRILSVLLAAFTIYAAAGCKKTPQQATEAKIAAEKADKRQKAIKNYQELIKKYPDSQFAEDARKRLQALGPAATPKK
jgi:predicted TPR repeat methyltransferase